MAAIKNMADICYDAVDMLVDEMRKSPTWGSAYSWGRYISAIVQLAEVSEEENAYWELVEDEIELNDGDRLLHFKDACSRGRNMALDMMLAQRGTSEPDPFILERLLEVAETSPSFREVVQDVLAWRKSPSALLELVNDPNVVSLNVLAEKVAELEPSRSFAPRD